MQEESIKFFFLRLLENKIKMKEINKKKNANPLIKQQNNSNKKKTLHQT